MINEYLERQKQLMGINENFETKIRRRLPKIKQIVNDTLYDSPDDAISGVVATSDDEFEFADTILDIIMDVIDADSSMDLNLSNDEYDELRDFIKDEFGFEMIEYYYDQS